MVSPSLGESPPSPRLYKEERGSPSPHQFTRSLPIWRALSPTRVCVLWNAEVRPRLGDLHHTWRGSPAKIPAKRSTSATRLDQRKRESSSYTVCIRVLGGAARAALATTPSVQSVERPRGSATRDFINHVRAGTLNLRPVYKGTFPILPVTALLHR